MKDTRDEKLRMFAKIAVVYRTAKYRTQDRIQYKINHKVAMSGNFCLRGLSLIYDEAGL